MAGRLGRVQVGVDGIVDEEEEEDGEESGVWLEDRKRVDGGCGAGDVGGGGKDDNESVAWCGGTALVLLRFSSFGEDVTLWLVVVVVVVVAAAVLLLLSWVLLTPSIDICGADAMWRVGGG
jgi:hypothetical protein